VKEYQTAKGQKEKRLAVWLAVLSCLVYAVHPFVFVHIDMLRK
jgi:hypothetical protein